MNVRELVGVLQVATANHRGFPTNVQVLTEEADVYDVVDVEYDAAADTVYIKVVLAEE